MLKDIAIYILSHNRVNVKTLATLRELHFNSDYYIVIDDEDPSIEEYKRIFTNNLLVFNKKEQFNKYDSISSSFNKSSPWYARNFIISHALKHGYKYLIQSDDDITRFYNRYRDVEGGSVKRHPVYDIEDIISKWITFINCNENIGGICPAIDSSYPGGVGKYDSGLDRKIYQFMLLKLDDIRLFSGLHAEDFILTLQNCDKIYFTDYNISFATPQMGSNSGGVEYTNILNDNYYLNIVSPTSVYITKSNQYSIKNDNAYPKIISDYYKN